MQGSAAVGLMSGTRGLKRLYVSECPPVTALAGSDDVQRAIGLQYHGRHLPEVAIPCSPDRLPDLRRRDSLLPQRPVEHGTVTDYERRLSRDHRPRGRDA